MQTAFKQTKLNKNKSSTFLNLFMLCEGARCLLFFEMFDKNAKKNNR